MRSYLLGKNYGSLVLLQKNFWWIQKAFLHSLLHKYENCRCIHMHKNIHTYIYCIHTALDICLSPLIHPRSSLFFGFISFFFFELGKICWVDDEKEMLLLLKISHPALSANRCHAIMATLNCQHLAKPMEAWWRFCLSYLCGTLWTFRDHVETNKSCKTSFKQCTYMYTNMWNSEVMVMVNSRITNQ